MHSESNSETKSETKSETWVKALCLRPGQVLVNGETVSSIRRLDISYEMIRIEFFGHTEPIVRHEREKVFLA